jgi:hypothetical protein
MTAMTYPILPDRGAGLEVELQALAPIGGARRPVKVVEHPAFAARRRLRAQALASSLTVIRVPVVLLDPRPPSDEHTGGTYAAAGAGAAIATTPLIAA